MFRIIILVIVVYVFYRFVLVFLMRTLTENYLSRQKKFFFADNPDLMKKDKPKDEKQGFGLKKSAGKNFISFFTIK